MPWYDLVLSALALAGGAHLVWHYERLATRISFVDPLQPTDIAVALMLIALTLEACRRVVGWSLPAIAGVFLAYQFVGPWMPGLLRHGGILLSDLAEQQGLSVQGLFGIPTGVISNYVFYFILFAAFMEVSGGGQLFIDLAFRLTGRRRGGPAKGAIVGSSLMGTISGSAVANVSGTGVFTIPLMKKAGYPAAFAGAVEAVASTGGQLMPPIMGSAAFIMAEMVGIPYLEIALYAVIPAIAYYLALFLMVDLKAKQEGLVGLEKEELPQFENLKARLVLLLPMAILVYHIFARYSLQRAAFTATLAVVVVGMFSRVTRLSPADILKGLETGARRAVGVTVPAAAAGIVVGVVSYTGIGLKFSSLIIMTSGGYLVPALILIMIGCIILGMGMPTSGAYIMGAILMAPALQNMGIGDVPAHLFVLYFCALSMVDSAGCPGLLRGGQHQRVGHHGDRLAWSSAEFGRVHHPLRLRLQSGHCLTGQLGSDSVDVGISTGGHPGPGGSHHATSVPGQSRMGNGLAVGLRLASHLSRVPHRRHRTSDAGGGPGEPVAEERRPADRLTR